jgi:stearoyl-CoA desaturase (delta-9 desaturase)
MYLGVLDLPWWGYILVTLALTHLTIASVTIYLHRHSAHRALDLHPLASHFFRLWLWLTTGMGTKAWTAIHRKHHARCDTEDDPHSPQVKGIRSVLLQGAELYKLEARNHETIERFGQGTPDDWIERHLYKPHTVLGLGVMLGIDLVLFGAIGLTMWAVQMIWIPLFAAGVINGVGHYWGYRTFQTEEASRNISPWGVLIGGEELHNNHHAHPSSARLSHKWWEIDVGWIYIRILSLLRLATIKKTAPRVRRDATKKLIDHETLQAIVLNRYEILAAYTRAVAATCWRESAGLQSTVPIDRKTIRRWLRSHDHQLSSEERLRIEALVTSSPTLMTVHTMRIELSEIWRRSSLTKDQLIRQIEDWCRRAEQSGVRALGEFSRRLRVIR